MVPGDAPILSGLKATRLVQFDNVQVLAYMLWVNEQVNVQLVDGSSSMYKINSVSRLCF